MYDVLIHHDVLFSVILFVYAHTHSRIRSDVDDLTSYHIIIAPTLTILIQSALTAKGRTTMC